MVYLLQRALAAFRADSFRCSGVSLLALALPPFNPPSLPRATAAGFLEASSGDCLIGSPFGCGKIYIWTDGYGCVLT